MEFCSGSDLSIYIKNRGRLPTLDFLPRGAVMDVDKVFWPHPPTGGIDERITRCFLGQLGMSKNLPVLCQTLTRSQPKLCSFCDRKT